MVETGPLPPKSPSSICATVKASDEILSLGAPNLAALAGSTKQHRRTPSRSDITRAMAQLDWERNKTPPLVTASGDKTVVPDKKRSPVSTVDFDYEEEMKISIEDDGYVARIVHNLVPPPLSAERRSFDRSESFECDNEDAKKAASLGDSSPPSKPPLRPKAKRLSRSNTSPAVLEGSEQGEEAMLSLADDCLSNGGVATALALYESLFQDLAKKYGRLHPQVARCLDRMGEVYLRCGQFEKAVAYLESAISIRSMVLGVYHVDVACSMEKLATAKLHLNEIHHAHDAFRRALRIKRCHLGLYHQDVARIHTQLACIYFYAGEMLSAQASFEEALDVYRHLSASSESAASEASPTWTLELAETLCSIGSVKLSEKKYSRAIAYFQDGLKIQKQVFGLYHSSVIKTLDNLGYAHAKGQQNQIASEIYEEMLHAQITFHRGYNLDCYQTLKKLNYVYEKLGKLHAAMDANLEAISLQNRAVSRDDVVYKKTKKLLERVQKKLAIDEKKVREQSC